MKRRILSGIVAWLLILSMGLPFALAAEAEETEATEETVEETTEEAEPRYSMATSGSCGDNVTWQLDGHTLTITGSGKIDAGSPWEFYKDAIDVLILDGEITHIGDEAFSTCNNLRYIDFGDHLVEIGYQAFYSCNALEAIRLPDTFRRFGVECFRDCDNLQVVYCDGPMPSFKGSCLYTNHTVEVFYSHETPWPQEEVSRLMTNFGSRLYVDVGSPDVLEEYLDAQSFAVPETQPLPPETEPEPTVPETTAPPVTVPVTEPVPTVPETTAAPEPAREETQPVFVLESEPMYRNAGEPFEQEEPEKGGISGIVWVIIAAALVTGILVMALVIRMVLHSGGRYSD